MKGRIFSFISLLLSVVMISSAVPAAAVQGEEKYSTTLTVRAAEIKTKGAYKAIQSALNAAHYSATRDNPYRVEVEAGTYELRSALHLYSNTTLSLNNVTLFRNAEATCNLIRTGDDSAADKGDQGYDANVNIKLEGGTLDGNATSNTMVKVAHATNFTMSGTTLQNLKNAHMMEIAGVDGFTVQNCTFKDQVLGKDDVGYEAIQLDILKSGHIVGCRSEALNMRNVRIEGCYFDNVPRGVGTHTSILNHPFDGITIKNNVFKHITSAAIQGQNWMNCEISNNTIDGTPRAIALYSVFADGSGCFKAETLAKEGKTATDISSAYQKPSKSNILIANNTIKNCGTVKDIYASYTPLAISVIGSEVTKAGKANSDGSGGLPKGDYYLHTVTVKNNDITTAGHGVYINNVYNAAVEGNAIECIASDNVKDKANAVSVIGSNVSRINYNSITRSQGYGMELSVCKINYIKGNSISNIPLSGIMLNGQTEVTNLVSDNLIANAVYGLAIASKSKAAKVTENIFSSCSKGMVYKAKNAVATVSGNYDKVVGMTSLSLNEESLTLGAGEKFTLKTTYAPKNVIAKFTWSSSDTGVASVNEKGVVTAHQVGKATITVKSASGKTAVCAVNVLPAPDSLTFADHMLTIGYGESVDLHSTLPAGTVSHSIQYNTNHSAAVSVNGQSGVITGVGIGTATIVAETYNGKRANCNVIVKYAPYDIWFDKRELNMGVGEAEQLNMIFPEGSAAHGITYASTDEKVVAVTQSGALSALSEGEATVTATAYNGAVAICYVTVGAVPVTVAFEKQEYSLSVGESLTPTVVLADGTASNAMSFQSSDPDICRVDKETGELTAKRKGVVTLTVKTYNHLAASCTVVVR